METNDSESEAERTQDLVLDNDNRLIRNKLLTAVSMSSCHFKNQQRGDPDLSVDEKRHIAEKLLSNNPSEFLKRFGNCLSVENLAYFDIGNKDYRVAFQVNEVRKLQNQHLNRVQTRNRRYSAMKKLLAEGQYFSEESMKNRDPLLYERMVGKHLSTEQIKQQSDAIGTSLSGIFLNHIQASHNNELYDKLKAKDIADGGESSSDEEVENIEEFDTDDEDERAKSSRGRAPLTQQDIIGLTKEFQEIMEQRFLGGKDVDFNYSEIDNNPEYDSLDICNQDEEDKYFNDEEPDDMVNAQFSKAQPATQTAADNEVDYMDFPL